jgi:predicted metal-binding protein
MPESKANSKNKLTSVSSPVTRALVMICDKCGRKLEESEEKNPSRVIQKRLKQEFKEVYGKGAARAVTTSCLDICPEDRIAVGIVKFGEERSTTEFFLVEGQDCDGDMKAIFEKI